MPNVIDVTGQRFGRLVAIEIVKGSKPLKWLCKCDCGKDHLSISAHLRNGTCSSCGCLHKEKTTTHGMTKIPEYKIWNSMIARCKNQRMKNYKHYGGRGITVCERWMKFEGFISDMGIRPSDNHSLERIDNNSGYSPDNCKWATSQEQSRNKRPSLPSKFGCPGIRFNDKSNRYNVRIMVNRKEIHVGAYNTLEEAITARKEAEKIHWSSF